jgi:peptidoglycan hydrolase CwlO-like protein
MEAYSRYVDELRAIVASYKRELADAKEKIEFLKRQILDQQRTLDRLSGNHTHF